jgi:hypothetical protein
MLLPLSMLLPAGMSLPGGQTILSILDQQIWPVSVNILLINISHVLRGELENPEQHVGLFPEI